MAISADTVWEIRTNGTANGGGGFVAGASGTDYSQQDAVHSARTDIVIDGVDNTKITSAGDNFASDDIGNIINITAGTGFTVGRYEITAVAAGVATLDATVGTVGSTGGSGTVGGAMTFTSGNVTDILAGNTVYLKDDGTYSVTSAITFNAGADATPIIIEGYNTTRGDGGDAETNKAVISSSSAGHITVGVVTQVKYLDINQAGTNPGLTSGADCLIYKCKIHKTTGAPSCLAVSPDSAVILCEFSHAGTGDGIGLADDLTVFGCYFHDIAGDGVNASSTSTIHIVNNIFDTCTTSGVKLTTSDGSGVIGCTFYNCGLGINVGTGATTNAIINNIFDNCTTGIDFATTSHAAIINCNFSNNTNDILDGVDTFVINDTYVDPSFADAANGDFAVGTSMRNIGAGGTFPGGLSVGYMDLGAVQRAEAIGYVGYVG